MFARLQEALGTKQKKRLSLAELKALNAVMEDNEMVEEHNQNLIVESLRSIAEIVIWGDQNDPKVFEYFLEKNMIAYFDKFLGQGAGAFINTQLLQTLMMLLDNIDTPTSIWFLLSKNHMNSIITHKFDFQEEEVLAYYISFMKSLSMKLTPDTLLFFHNEHLPDFPLYTEAVKFFNHKESMVRVAVRTLTLQVFKAALHNEYTAEFLSRKVPEYFSNLVWVVGNRSIAMDACLNSESTDGTPVSLGQLEAHVAEHLDLFCYMSDVVMLNFKALTDHLSVQLVDSLFIPLYVHCITSEPTSPPVKLFPPSEMTVTPPTGTMLTPTPTLAAARLAGGGSADATNAALSTVSDGNGDRSIGVVVALYLTAQMLLIFDHPPVVNTVTAAILLGKAELGEQRPGDVDTLSFGLRQMMDEGNRLADVSAAASSKVAADAKAKAARSGGDDETDDGSAGSGSGPVETAIEDNDSAGVATDAPAAASSTLAKPPHASPGASSQATARPDSDCRSESLARIVRLLDPSLNDVVALQTMVLLHAALKNQGVYGRIRTAAGLVRPETGAAVGGYDHELVKALLWVVEVTARVDQCARLSSLSLAIHLTLALTVTPPDDAEEDPVLMANPPCVLVPEHRALVEQVYDFAVAQLSQLYGKFAERGREARGTFLDLFELEHKRVKPVKVPLLMSQASVLLVPTSEERGNMDFEWRLPKEGEETARRTMQTFFYIRRLWLKVNRRAEKDLPLRQPTTQLHVRDSIDMTTVRELIACTVVSRAGKSKQLIQARRFMMIDGYRLSLLEAQTDKPGFGLVRFVHDLNQVIACPETHNTRALSVVIRTPSTASARGGTGGARATPAHTVVFSGRFVFDDHIRCVAAQQYLERGRATLRNEKVIELEALMGMKPSVPSTPSTPLRPGPGSSSGSPASTRRESSSALTVKEPTEHSDDGDSAILAEPDSPVDDETF
eukprot:m.12143 g.12143  ORF g.12143 m.12143 type:complete len:956 (-) comp2913_c0_seq1:150-3017(-)